MPFPVFTYPKQQGSWDLFTSTYNVQTYDVNPIGTATNLLSILDQDNIEKIAIVKDFKDIGWLAPRAANGAVYITTKNAKPGEKLLSVNGYFGYALTPGVNTLNAASEKNFRPSFLSKVCIG